MSVYKFSVNDIGGDPVLLKEYMGKVILIVNTASSCGFTPQYEGLENLFKKYQNDFTVLAFPCNQFGAQESGSEKEISEFCNLRFNISFPLFSKIEVNGKNEHKLFTYLKSSLPGLMGSKKIKWNFTKFLIDKEGNPVQRYAPTATPESLEKDILKLIKD